MSMFLRPILAAVVLVIAAFPGSTFAAPAASTLVHIRGTIAAVSPSALTVTTDRGSEQVALSPSTPVAGVVPATASDIKPNTFIGTANVSGGGTSRALEVVVFPDSMRGTGEGNYPWDLQSRTGSSMMTNGTVSRGSMMTNGTVSSASSTGQLTLTVTYKGGSKHISVPPNIPIVRIVPGDHSLLKPGAHVFIIAKPASGRFVASRIIVGEHGTVPPM